MSPFVPRPLSASERWYWIADSYAPLNICGVLRLRGSPPDSQSLKLALARLQSEIPALRTRIMRGSGKKCDPCFETSTEPIPLRTAAGWDGSEEFLRALAEEEVNCGFDTAKGPLIRVVLVPRAHEFSLLVLLCHAVADGISGGIILHRMLTLLAGGASGPAPVAAFPALESRLPRWCTWALPSLLTTLAFQIADGLRCIMRKPIRLPSGGSVPFKGRRTRLLSGSVDAARMRALLARCKAEGVTFHCMLTAALARAVAAEVAPTRAVTVRIGTPANLRQVLSPPLTDEVGAYVSSLVTWHQVRPGADQLVPAKEFALQVRQSRARGLPFIMLGALRWFAPRDPETAEAFLKLVDAQGPGHLTLSNTGNVPMAANYGAYSLADVRYFASLSTTGAFLALFRSFAGTGAVGFSYVEGVVSEATARNVARNLLAELESFAPTSTSPCQNATMSGPY